MEKGSIKRVAIIGPESTGKTWLCEKLAEHFETSWVPEYAREYFNDSDIYNYTLDDLVKIAKKQIQLEKYYEIEAKKYLFCDTSLITLKIWSVLEFEEVPEFIYTNLPLIKYDLYLLTDTSIPWKKDEQRQNKHDRSLIFDLNLWEISRLDAECTVIRGLEDERLQTAIKAVEKL